MSITAQSMAKLWVFGIVLLQQLRAQYLVVGTTFPYQILLPDKQTRQLGTTMPVTPGPL